MPDHDMHPVPASPRRVAERRGKMRRRRKLAHVRLAQHGVRVYVRVQHTVRAVIGGPDGAAARAYQFEAGACLTDRLPATQAGGKYLPSADVTGTPGFDVFHIGQ